MAKVNARWPLAARFKEPVAICTPLSSGTTTGMLTGCHPLGIAKTARDGIYTASLRFSSPLVWKNADPLKFTACQTDPACPCDLHRDDRASVGCSQ
jgi:hypothetical protein